MSQYYRQAHFITSAFDLTQLLPDEGREIAFAGRSNAGKSSAINRLTDQQNLCKTSKTPGRTQLINFFGLDDTRRLVDLPGYGYAKVPVKMRNHWNHVLSGYLLERQALCGLIIVMDVRRGLTDLDWGLIELVDDTLPIHLLMTKADKLKQNARNKTLNQVQKQVEADTITVSLFSATTGLGLDQFASRCDELLDRNDQALET